MPLLILGLIVLVGLLVIAIFNYFKGAPGDQASPMRRERERNASSNTKEDDDNSGKVLYFPVDNVETEKRKRN